MRLLRSLWNTIRYDRQSVAQIAGALIGAGDLIVAWLNHRAPSENLLVFAGTLIFLSPTVARRQGTRNTRRNGDGDDTGSEA